MSEFRAAPLLSCTMYRPIFMFFIYRSYWIQKLCSPDILSTFNWFAIFENLEGEGYSTYTKHWGEKRFVRVINKTKVVSLILLFCRNVFSLIEFKTDLPKYRKRTGHYDSLYDALYQLRDIYVHVWSKHEVVRFSQLRL